LVSHIVQQQPPALFEAFDLLASEVLAAGAAPDLPFLGLVSAKPRPAESAKAANASTSAHRIRHSFMLFSRSLSRAAAAGANALVVQLPLGGQYQTLGESLSNELLTRSAAKAVIPLRPAVDVVASARQ
jgi:hypothetical protein